MKKEYDLKNLKRVPRTHVAAPDATVPVSVRMPLDIKAWLEKEGEQRGLGYQSAMFTILRAVMSGEHAIGEKRIREIFEEEYQKRRQDLAREAGAGERTPYAPPYPAQARAARKK